MNKSDVIVDKIIHMLHDYGINHDLPLNAEIRNYSEYETFITENSELYFRDLMLHKVLLEIPKDHEISFSYDGKCELCGMKVKFLFNNRYGGGTEGVLCSKCGQNMRLRYIFSQIKNIYRLGQKVYISEYRSKFFTLLKSFIPNIHGSEYDPEHRFPSVPHQDSEHLSFKDNEFDLYISNDVFEHVYNYKAAFKEAHRILKDTGTLLFHVPFHAAEKNTIIRAKIDENGGHNHILPPVYHGDPLSSHGILCVNDFGWDILTDLRDAGFNDACITMSRNFNAGFLGRDCLAFIGKKICLK